MRILFVLLTLQLMSCGQDPYLTSMEICESPNKNQRMALQMLAPQVDMNYFSDSCKPLFEKVMNTDKTIHFYGDRVDTSLLKSLVNIRSLRLSFNDEEKERTISNLDFLEGYTQLKHLEISFANELVDISGIKNISSLESLTIRFAELKDISDLSNLVKLSVLDLNNNKIDDISVVSSLPNLKVLNLEKNKILDISVLSELKNIEKLNLSQNYYFKSYSPLKNIHSLTELNISFMNIGNNIGLLKGLTNLKVLDITENKITTIKPLQNLHGLIKLRAANNNIEDISILEGFKNIEHLDLGNNRMINDISSIKGLNKLVYLDIHSNKIKDISPLHGLSELKKLQLFKNPIKDCAVLMGSSCSRCIYVCSEYIKE